MLAIIDYEAGNQTSVYRALEHLGIKSVITSDAEILRKADGIIFPGVGAAGQAMEHVQKVTKDGVSLEKLIKDFVGAGKPLLGICLGCQILLEYSQENDTKCLGIVDGLSVRFDPNLKDMHKNPIRVPHMGWNAINIKQDSPLLYGVHDKTEFYFVHSYYVLPSSDLVIATSNYGLDFCSMYGRDGLWAVQFHLEKSGKAGLQVLSNFNNYCLNKGACRC